MHMVTKDIVKKPGWQMETREKCNKYIYYTIAIFWSHVIIHAYPRFNNYLTEHASKLVIPEY